MKKCNKILIIMLIAIIIFPLNIFAADIDIIYRMYDEGRIEDILEQNLEYVAQDLEVGGRAEGSYPEEFITYIKAAYSFSKYRNKIRTNSRFSIGYFSSVWEINKAIDEMEYLKGKLSSTSDNYILASNLSTNFKVLKIVKEINDDYEEDVTKVDYEKLSTFKRNLSNISGADMDFLRRVWDNQLVDYYYNYQNDVDWLMSNIENESVESGDIGVGEEWFEYWRPSTPIGNTKIKQKASRILGAIQVVGSIASVLGLMIIGIKYLLASPEGKAKYKETLVPYVVGCCMLFASSNIASIIYKFAIRLG